ncbi:hypothetical protein JNM05_09850, partial [bacterium]|nr:hypothetical protein [bacterium]
TNSGVPFDLLKAEDPLLPLQQVYLIDKTRTGSDYINWPEDALRDQFGYPALIADAQTWAVFNDIDTSLNSESLLEPDPGLGIQVILESYVFNEPKIGDVVFMRFTLSNKTSTNYPQSYFAVWSDPDVGNATNDIVGVDTTRHLGFTYNYTNESAPGNPDRAAGFDILQGPVVHIAEIPANEAQKFVNNKNRLIYSPSKNRYESVELPLNNITLGATAFYGVASDPGLHDWSNSGRYDDMRGVDPYSHQKKHGCGLDDYFTFRANPLVGISTCDLAGVGNPNPFAGPSDMRNLLSTGPFTIKAGESQDVWIAALGAVGNNRLLAVANLFATDDLAQSFFDAGFPAPAPPEIPNFTVSALDKRVILTWQNNAELSDDLAGELLGITTANGYSENYVRRDFQGYRIYRSLTGLDGSFELLIQFDKVDTLGLLSYRLLNSNFNLEIREMNFGSNTGLRYTFTDSNLINGQNYFYSVTAYDAQPYIAGPDSMLFDGQYILKPAGIPVSLESSVLSNAVAAVPQKIVSTVGSEAKLGSAGVIHTSGMSDATVQLEVVDPSAVIDGNYTIEFFYLPDSVNGKEVIYKGNTFYDELVFKISRDGGSLPFSSKSDDSLTWIDGGNGILDRDAQGNLINGDALFDDRFFSTSYRASSDTPQFFKSTANSASWEPELSGVCEGILIRISIPPNETKGWGYTGGTGTGTRWMTGINLFSGQFFGSLGFAPNISDTILDADIVFSDDPAGWSVAYGHTSFSGIQNETFLVPFTAYEVDAKDGDTTPRKLNVLVRDDNDLNGWYLDNTLGGDYTGPAKRPYIYITNRDYDAGTHDAIIWGKDVFSIPAMFVCDMAPRNSAAWEWNNLVKEARMAGSDGDSIITLTEQDTIYRNIPDDGTFHIYANHVITANDVFTYSTTARTVASKSDVKRTLKDIKVVPNPFYKYSSFETSFDKLIKFTNLPSSCTIKIFTVTGDLVKTLTHNQTSNNDRVNYRPYDENYAPDVDATSIERWDLKTANGRYVASGMYIALIESSAGKKLVKFAVIQ